MSMTILVCIPKLDDGMIIPWIKRMNECGMSCEVHPDFSFETSQGFVPFKLRLERSAVPILASTDYLTGFQYYKDPCEFAQKLSEEQNARLDMPGDDGGLKVAEGTVLISEYTYPIAVARRLRECQVMVTLDYGPADIFEFRVAMLSGAILAHLCDGVCCETEGGEWFFGHEGAVKAISDVENYETSMPEDYRTTHPFEGWR